MTKQYELTLAQAALLSRTELLALMATIAEAIAKQDSPQLDSQWQTQPHWEELNSQQPENASDQAKAPSSNPLISILRRGLSE